MNRTLLQVVCLLKRMIKGRIKERIIYAFCSFTSGTVDLEASGPISIVYGLRNSSNKRKKKENESDSPAGSVPIKKNDKRKDKGKDNLCFLFFYFRDC
jgi:hypothetical protein